MPATVTAQATTRVQISSTNNITGSSSANAISTPITVDDPQGGAPIVFTNGAGTNQVSIGFADVRAYAATPTTLDLTSLAAAATNTGAAAFAGIKILKIVNLDSTNAVTIGGAASNQFLFNGWSQATNTEVLKAGATKFLVDPSAAGMVVGSSNKSLKLDPGANTVSLGIFLAGI